MKRIYSWLSNFFLFLFSSAFILLVLFTFFEIFPDLPVRLNLTRVYYYALKTRYIPDPKLVMRIKPFYSYQGTFTGDISGLFARASYKPLPYDAHYDEFGFRNNHSGQKTDIVVMGDSYLEVGLTNQDTFAAHLETSTGKLVANLGSGWYGPDQYLEVFKRYGLKHQPRAAIFCFFEGNDLKDLRQYENWKRHGSYYHFNFYNGSFFKRFFLSVKDTSVFLGKLFVRRWDPRRAEIKLSSGIYETVFVDTPELRNPDQLAESFEIKKLREIFFEFKQICETHKIRPLIVFIPTKAHIYLPYASLPSLSKIQREEQTRHQSYVEDAVKQIAAETGIAYLSLVPRFEQAAKEGEFLYYETDTHWNTRGRILAAKEAASLLSSLEGQNPNAA